MNHLTIRRRSALPLLTGLAVAQSIATFFVRRSNLDLQQSVSAMQKAGWLAVPSGPAAESLNSLAAAFWGALFYTLSVGVGLALATWALLYLWQRLGGSPRLLWVAAGAWAALAVFINFRGWVLYPTLFVVCVPLATLLASLRKAQAGRPAEPSARLWLMPLITLALMTGLWATQFNAQIFTTIRDHLLLSNPVGRSVNDFYYRYTLHAAQSFKSFGQKTLRTCRLASVADAQSPEHWIRLLANHDVVTIQGDTQADVLIQIDPKHVVLTSAAGDRMATDRQAFLTDPGLWLGRFSEAGDRYAPLRRLTFAGLLLGFPILLFAMVDGAVGRLAERFVGGAAVIWWRCGVCLIIGILLLIPMLARHTDIPRDAVASALTAERWPQRVAALRLIEREKLEISAFPQYRHLIQSPLVVERYYAARALSFSRTPATLADLLALIRDAHPNVVCQAYHALGRRGNPSAVEPIKAQMAHSDHWYTQWYGYRAIRSLGWRQSR
ncbi:MAG: HEAT repeat domain-containing protein [Desulfobacteraceae bacterium]|nr:MAG: HEAT repeat domain-containing protein [Desulfobacteraceae bacterium]